MIGEEEVRAAPVSPMDADEPEPATEGGRVERIDRPELVDILTGGVFPTSGNLLLDLNVAPAAGRMWHVSRVALMHGAGPVAGFVAAGVALYSFVGSPDVSAARSDSIADFADVSVSGNGAPVVAFYADWQMPVRAGETCYWIMTGGVVGEFYAISGLAKDVPDPLYDVKSVYLV